MKESTPNRMKNNFDQLRLVAAFFVIITHSYALLGLPENDILYRLTRGTVSFSRLGLWIFFVISGYLITASASRSSSVWVYVKKRLLRIVPGFFAVILFCAFIVGAIFTSYSVAEYISNPITWDYLKGMAFFRLQYNLPGVFVSNPYPGAVNGSLWTIPYEVLLYTLPIAGVVISKYVKKQVFKSMLLVLWILAIVATKQISPILWDYTIPVFLLNAWHLYNFGIFFVGGMLVWLYKDMIPMTLGVCVSLAVVWVASFFTSLAGMISYLCVPYIILFLAQKPVITFQKIQQIPDISYGLYLYAFPVQQILALYVKPSTSVGFFAVLSLCVTIPFAWASWKYIEEPFLRLKNI
jgi:peptidoglycan/LPS O-acetylase OafA/YrhL